MAKKRSDKPKRFSNLGNLAFWLVFLVVIAVLGYYGWWYAQSGIEEHGIDLPEKPGYRAVHWHPEFDIVVCGRKRGLPLESGTNLLHTHKNPRLGHIEGYISNPAEHSLGLFMNTVEVKLTENCIMDKCAPEQCPDSTTPGALTVTINGQPTADFLSYPLQDGNQITITYA